MEIIDTTKSLIENLYYLSGTAILTTIIIGLRQLVLTKRTFQISSQRAAADLAARQIEIYFDKIIPLQNNVFRLELEKELKRVEIEMGEFHQDYLKEKIGKEEFDKQFNNRLPIGLEILKMANAMEAFSVYFVKGVADEEIAYSSVGRTFCSTVESYYFDIASSLEKDDNKYWCNMIELYYTWSKRLKSEKLTVEKEKIADQLASNQSQGVKPIGTN